MNGLIPADPIKMNEQKLTKTKKILPQEWIQDYFNPVVGVLSTPDVNALCHKNNLSMGPVFLSNRLGTLGFDSEFES